MRLRFSSLSVKLAVALLVLFLIVGGLTLAVTLATSHLYQLEVQQGLHSELAEHILAEYPLIEHGEVADEALEDVFHMMMVINPTIELYLLDPAGEILAYSAPPGRVKLSHVDISPLKKLIEGHRKLPVVGDDPRHPERQKIFSAAPILREGILEGYLYIVLASEQYVSAAGMLRGSHILRAGAWAVIGTVIITLVGALLISRHLVRRLSDLNRDMTELRRKTLDDPESVEPPPDAAGLDEIDQLRSAFSVMAARIESQIEELREQNRLRREMVANVSHDLRTPLAHLQGFLETLMLKEDALEPDQRREYLEIAHRHGERLSRLVADLFELAKLEAVDEPLVRETLPVSELVQDLVQKYRLHARERGIAMNASLSLHETPSLISADIRLIERALENVIENALRYTPPGGSIDVNIEPVEQWIKIEVKDTGPGIADEDLQQVFDRHYRASSAVNDDDDRGAGLGLAIARRAVEPHGGSLDCESHTGRGTTFRFGLPAA